MKKLALCFVLLICICVMGFTQEETKKNSADILFSIGPAFENCFINGSDLEKKHIGSLGINMNLYTFFEERNIGLFFNLGILRPMINNYGSLAHTDLIPIGLGYRYKLNENLIFHFGFGPSLNMIFMDNNKNIDLPGDFLYGLGVGGCLGANYILTKHLSLNIGTIVSYNFAAYREIRKNVDYQNPNRDIEESGWVDRYSMIGIKPYFAIGFNF